MLERYPETRSYNSQNHTWRFRDGQRIELGYLDNDKDVFRYQGTEIDGLFPDELTQFPRDWYLYLFSRIRSTKPGQRKRVLATTNPGGDNEAWVKARWAAWLDRKHPNPAKSGEIRWYHRLETSRDYAEEEIPADHPSVAAGMAWSRTFIRAGIADNPAITIDYLRNLDMLPEPHRSQLKRGDWEIGTNDNEWQVIPTEWILAAQERWQNRYAEFFTRHPDGKIQFTPQVPLTQLGIDVARGGKDFTVLEQRFGTWFAEPVKHPGATTPDGMIIAQHVGLLSLPDGVPVAIDIIGVGSSPADILTQNGYNVVAMNGAEGSEASTKTGQRFKNKRAEWYWKLREALDPHSGEDLALPPGPEVLSDLSASRWRMTSSGILIEPKDDIKERIGRSPDVGDTIVYAHAQSSGKNLGVLDYFRQQANRPQQSAFGGKGAPPPRISTTPSACNCDGSEQVTIGGENFDGASLMIDGVNVAIIARTPVAILFQAPQHAPGPVVVAVTTPSGTVTTRFTYV